MDVESLAVSKINSLVARCPHLKAFISVNDKTPFTDGYIDLYDGTRQSKADWTGRVPVQVKGRTVRIRKGSPLTHSIPRTDLLAYQKESGVLYFFVAVHPKTSARTAHYALLSPFGIEALLGRVGSSQATISVSLKKLPNEPTAIERIVALALKTRDQNLSVGFDPVLFDHLESFTVHTASELVLDAPITLTSGVNDFALVLHTTDGLSIPVGGELRIIPPEYRERNVNLRAVSGGVVYEAANIKRLDSDAFEVILSEGLRLVFRSGPGSQSTTAHLTLEKDLSGRIKAIEFFTALLDTRMIELNGQESPFEIITNDKGDWLRAHSKTLRELSALLDTLQVDSRLVELDQIDERQSRQLNVLHRGFVECNEIVDPSLRVSRVTQNIGEWELMFLVVRGSAPGRWRFVDPFSVDVRRQFSLTSEGDREERIPITAYDLVEPEHLGRVMNMRLESIVGAYEAIADCPKTSWLANQRVLALISAADSSESRKDELLDAAARLNDWLLAQEGRESHHLINRWQISWRQGGLSHEERSDIRRLRRQIVRSAMDSASQVEVACALLLGEREEIEELLVELSIRERQQLEDWPIWRLRQGLADAPAS